ncbi:MAG: flavin reductase family protein [Deltaproteobacteria bacterium]|nr:flavin reductase family protein [Deltaproteobacteria bacterium]MRR54654.1 flavin reductase family protein [Deltaproteobacteria bacterium]TLN02448.1 MAG: flavin reductase family protein [bacterium]
MKKSIKKGTYLFPTPTAMVSCAAEDGVPNIITIAWVGVVCSEPPVLSVSIRPGRYSHGLIKKSGEFVVNIPRDGQIRELDFCGVASGREVDKFKELGLTPVQGSEVAAPLIKECPVNLECRVIEIKSLGTHDLFLGEIVAAHMDEEVMNEKGVIDIARLSPIAYCPQASQYWSLKEAIGTYGFTGGKK